MLQIQEMQLSKLKPWEDNPRLNDQAVSAVAQSIRTFGFNVPILCDQNLTIVAGHTRWKAAKELDLKVVPVIVLEMTDAQRRAFSVADNKTAEIADWDFPKLREVLAELSSEDVDLGELGFSDEELRRYLGDVGKDEDEMPGDGRPTANQNRRARGTRCSPLAVRRFTRQDDDRGAYARRRGQSRVRRPTVFQPARIRPLGGIRMLPARHAEDH